MFWDWDPGWEFAALILTTFLAKPVAAIAVAAGVSAIAAAATGEVVSIKKSVGTGVALGIVVNVLIG